MPLPLLNILLFASEALAVSLILPALAWTLCRLLRERAALRHLIWLSVFGVLLLLPVLALLVPPQVILQQAPMATAYDPAPVVTMDAAPASFWKTSHIVMAFGALWAAGLLWNLSRLVVGFHGLHRLRRVGAVFHAGIDCDVRLADTAPLTFGWLKPVILLPLDAQSWPCERLDAVLGHEQAHVRRHDNLSNGLALLACAFYWPNPFLWLAHGAMCRDAEIAADDCVLAGGMKPSVYAAELLELTAEYRRRAPFAALAMASPLSLQTRVTSVLSPTPSRKGVTGMDVIRIAGLGSAAALMLAFARPGVAEAQAPAPARGPQPAALAMPVPSMPASEIGTFAIGLSAIGTPPPTLRPPAPIHAAAGQTNPMVSNPDGADGYRMDGEARLIARRNARDTLLKEKATQRQAALDAKFAQLEIDREKALSIKTAERTARLAQEKMTRDAAYTLR